MSPVVVHSKTLVSGKTYKVTVSGTFDAGDSIQADAEYSLRTGSSTEWTDSVSTYGSYGEQLLDLYVGSDNDWGTFNTEHIYTKSITGTGSALDFYINDVYPINNTGVLHVQIDEWGCAPTGFYRDGINMTAMLINPSDVVSGDVNATGCNIGVYYGPGSTGTVSGANVYGANYYGIVNHEGLVSISSSNIHDIGESPLNGSQHGVGIYFANVESGYGYQPACDTSGAVTTGEIKNNTIYHYQKGGMVINCTGAKADIEGNEVTGEGKAINNAQNGIQVSRGAHAIVIQNTVKNNFYGGGYWNACGLLFYQAGQGLKFSVNNTFSDNQQNICNTAGGPNINAVNNLSE